MTRVRDTKKYDFRWYKAGEICEIPKRQRNLYNMLVAVCGYSKRVAKLGSVLEAIIIRDMYHTDGTCEESARCVDFDCSLNSTTWESAKANGMVSKRAKQWEGFGTRIRLNNGPDGINDFSHLFESGNGASNSG